MPVQSSKLHIASTPRVGGIVRAAGVLLALWWSLCGAALAAPFAVVDGLSTQDARGEWRNVDETAQAFLVEGGQELPLRVGQELPEGAEIRTLDARVRIDLGDRERLHVSESAQLVVGERTVTQTLGEVYYKVRDAFTVDYGSVQTAVDGTRFSVAAVDDSQPVTVRVTKGQVRVSHEGGEPYVLQRGDAVTVGQDGASPGLETGSLGPGMSPGSFANTWLLGRPRLTLGLLGGGAYAGEELSPSTRLTVGLALPAQLSLEADLGVQPGATRLRAPVGLGLRWAPGALSLGGQLYSAYEEQELDCGGGVIAVHVGGAASVRGQLAVGRNISLLADLRGGYADALLAELSVGVGVGL